VRGLRVELEAFGFTVDVQEKHEGAVESAFVKADTRILLVRLGAPADVAGRTAANRIVRVKLETDTDPPAGIETEVRILLEPFPVSVRLVTLPCIFAGKLHATLCRAWKTRVKGRDWYDLVFLTARSVPVDIHHLEARLRQSGHWVVDRGFTDDDLRAMVEERIAEVDWRKAADDVAPFVRDPRSLDLWGPELFRDVARRIRCIDSPRAG